MKLNYKKFGQGEPLLILHGLFGMLDNWQTHARKLAEHFTVYILDARNHGRSPHHPEHSYAAMAQDLFQFLKDHDIEKARLIGHSMGGKTVMQFALSWPDMVDKLIVVDINPEASRGNHQAVFDALFSINLSELGSRSDAKEEMGLFISDTAILQFLLKNLHRNKAGKYHWKMNLTAIHENYPLIMAAIPNDDVFDNPTLFIRGGKSNYIHDEDWLAIHDLFPIAEMVTIEEAGHWVHADAPEVFLAACLEFLK